MKKMLTLSFVAAIGITIMCACNSNTDNKEGEKLSATSNNKELSASFTESNSYNQLVSSDYALACIKAYDSVYDVNNICKNEKAIAKAFTKSIGFPRHSDSLDVAKWIANLAKDSVTKNYDGVRIRLGVYVDPRLNNYKLPKTIIDNITAVDANGNSKIGRLTAFLWAYKTRNTASNIKNAKSEGDEDEEDLGEPLNLGHLEP